MSAPRSRSRFIADSMLGKLARWLRLLGYDARYERALDDAALVATAAEENRILLTRDRRLVERRACRRFLLLEDDDPWEQLQEVVRAFDLEVDSQGWFRRCLECNEPLETVGREAVRHQVPKYVFATQRRFVRCPGCQQVYWPGTHVVEMKARLGELMRRTKSLRGFCDGAARTMSGALVLLFLSTALFGPGLALADDPPSGSAAGRPALQQQDRFAAARQALLRELRAQGIGDEEVLAALGRVPRHRFVSASLRPMAYNNHPLPIGHGQTISQPYIVALMTELLEVRPGDRVLEIGTGSGYQAAVLAELGCDVHTIEIVPELGATAGRRLAELGYESIDVRIGDGYLGWPEEAPFDGVIVTAAPEEIPAPLVEQLRVGGRMVIPVGPQFGNQYLMLLEKGADGEVRAQRILPVRFVPFVRPGSKP